MPGLRFVAFWAAVSLPFLYVPLLVGGIDDHGLWAFFGLVVLHVVALAIGHRYRPP